MHAMLFGLFFQVGCNTDHHSWQPESSFMQIDNELHFCSCRDISNKIPKSCSTIYGEGRERERESVVVTAASCSHCYSTKGFKTDL